MGRQRSRAEHTLATNLPQLQNLIKRDPASYTNEFQQQLRFLQAQLQIVAAAPHQPPQKALPELLSFIAHTVPSYSATLDAAKAIPTTLTDLLKSRHGPAPGPAPPARDKQLRETLHAFIVNDIKLANAKHVNNKLNKATQNLLYSILTPPAGYSLAASADGSTAAGQESESGWSPVAAQKSLQICIELYKKNIWTDAKTVNVIAQACFSPVAKIMATAVHFFLGADKDEEQGDADDDGEFPGGGVDTAAVQAAQHQAKITKKSRANARKLAKLVTAAKKSNKPKNQDAGNGKVHFSALSLIYDPQAFAEKLFSRVKSSHFAFDTKLLLLNLTSRLIASHKLFLLGFYTYMQKYLQPHQRDVTSLLAYTAQASHDLVPPDVLAPVLRVIADQFVSDHASREVISAGINSIREICARCPLAMDKDLLSDLVLYKDHRDKSVVMAARSLIGLFREVNPSLCQRASAARRRVAAATRVAGAELLERSVAEQGWSGSEDGSDDDSDGEWQEVASDDGQEFIRLDDWSSDDSSSDSDSDSDSDEDEDATRFLTPADFARMAELRSLAAKEAPASKSKKRKRAVALLAEQQAAGQMAEFSEFVDETSLVPLRKKPKSDYEERMASIAAGREGREKFGSRKGKKEGKSTSNTEKRRTKDFNMVSKSRRVAGKKKTSLKEKTRAMRADIEKRKRAH
ncbi:SDA1-domain-containing protein [Catenaria anguillulae PL171]|uniref:Protein SDA1 n=1 Tax=Catenaria anguillulae PL171 TaxID=765915 RepID=A0A1Y2HXC0_9FUNG|nr:SDA1-domain-containing protein [Catenaria anguillulae PL171]